MERTAGVLMECLDPATFSDPDSIQRPVQSIQCIQKGFCFDLSSIPPKAFGHFVESQDRSFNISSRRCLVICRLFLWHSVALLQGPYHDFHDPGSDGPVGR